MSSKQVLILGTAARGGIQSVIEAYNEAGFYSPGSSRFIPTHVEGGMWIRVRTASRAFAVVGMLLLRSRVSLLHLHMSMRGSFWRKALFLLLGRLKGVPVIIHLHGSEFELFYRGSDVLTRRVIRGVFNRAADVVVLSESWRRFVGNLTTTPVTVVGNFVPDRFDPSRAKRIREPRAVLFLGQFGRRKGVYDLLEAFVTVRQHVPDAILYCCGNGEVERTRSMVLELGLSGGVEVPGWIDGNEKLELLHRCALFVLPSYNEGLPMAIIEAMSFSMAIASTNVGGIPELVDERNGKLVEPGDQTALARSLIQLLENDGEDIAEKGKVSRERYEAEYSPKAALTRMHRVYSSLGIEP